MTMRRRGNWSVLYVRMVCVTTLPKCLVHMVRSLGDSNDMPLSVWFGFLGFFVFFSSIIMTKTHREFGVKGRINKIGGKKRRIYADFYIKVRCLLRRSPHLRRQRQTRDINGIKDNAASPRFSPRLASDTLSELHPRGKLVFLARRPDLIGHGRIFYSITKTELFKLTFPKGKRVAGSGGAARLPRKCHNINELL